MSVDVVATFRQAGVARGDLVALVVEPAVGLGVAVVATGETFAVACDDPCALIAALDAEVRPRWVFWSIDTASVLVHGGARVATCWDIAAVHRLLFGGWRADAARVWAVMHDLALDMMPSEAPFDLFHQGAQEQGEADEPVRPDGYLRPEWASGEWSISVERLVRWAQLAAEIARLQRARLDAFGDRARAILTARSESTAELLCAALAADGLPMRRVVAEELIAGFVGRRPRNDLEAQTQRDERDAAVLRLVPHGDDLDLRSPGQVKSLLRRVGIEVPDTRGWRLEALREAHPVIEALLTWRKAERVATTYGYAWLDAHLGADDRLRGAWSGSDGSAGRMTASAGLHNMPADMRGAVIAEPGHVFVRADLGQIEPRVLAAVSGDRALAAATQGDDLYLPIAEQLGADRPTAKVAVLGAMYGQTTGRGAQVAGRLETTYPVAMNYLRDADRVAQGSRPLRTYGGRLINFGSTNANEVDEREMRRIAAARGRYGRNAMVQGAAAELFKVWAVLIRARSAALGAQIVLCLHDEVLVHVPREHGTAVAALVVDALDEAARGWAPDRSVRFVADVSVVERWSDAKA
jgi:DNA polymerase-1